MKVFILRARSGPTTPDQVDQSFGEPRHLEIVCHSIANALFISKDIRPDVQFYVVLEGPGDPSKTIGLRTDGLFWIGGFSETAIAAVIKRALASSLDLRKDQTIEIEKGLTVSRLSFERLVRRIGDEHPLYILSKRGIDIRDAKLPDNPCFIFTDHIPMQKNTMHLLKRLGTKKIGLGPRMLFASHCITLVHNELDRTGR
jgi:tRNA (pseudouridine54-N1)-methyltransferase